MRYSFHGKMRFTGQPIDGYIEAPSSTEAIDRLADEGVIGVYSVRPEPVKPKAQLLLPGQPIPEPEPTQAQAAAAQEVVAPLVERLQSLIGQVEKMLSRPMVAMGPTRNEGKLWRKSGSAPEKEQNAALRDIFQNNLDLRRSIEKLANAAAGIRPGEKPSKHEGNGNGQRIGVAAQPAA